MAQMLRAILLARAIATSMRGFFANIRESHELTGGAERALAFSTDIAPMISSRRISRCPIFDVFPRRGLPPVEH